LAQPTNNFKQTGQPAGLPKSVGWSRAALRRQIRRAERDKEELRRQNERLQRQLEEAQEQIKDKDKDLADKDKAIAEKDKQIADLERQLAARKKNSTNSSKAPSTDGVAGDQRKRKKRKKSKRKPGGQTGHDGSHRPLVEPERVDNFIPILPAECKHCGHELPQQPEGIQTTVIKLSNCLRSKPISRSINAQRFSARTVEKAHGRLFRQSFRIRPVPN